MRILVIGINIRHIAASACRAGHEVYAADSYCDRDLARWAVQTSLLPRQGAERAIPGIIQRFNPQAVVLGPGLEEAKVSGLPVLNNPPEKSAQVSDKLWLAGWLEMNGYPSIETLHATDAAEKAARGCLSYPFLVKPRKGAGGVGCRIIENPQDLLKEQWEKDKRNAGCERYGGDEGDGVDANGIDGDAEMIAQELLSGRPASVSVIGNGREARAVSINEQLIGLPWAGARAFRYSGNITPLDAQQWDIAGMAEEIVAGLGLLGSNGVDFMLTENGPRVLEVNSRFQGSLDCVEMAAECSIFSAHLQSFRGILPAPPAPPRRTAGRIIVYAPHSLTVRADLCRDWTQDVPAMGSRIEEGDPLLSITALGVNRTQVLALLERRASRLMALASQKKRWP